MRTAPYRLTVIGCVLAWFFVGLHLPALHGMTHHGGPPRWDVLAATALLAGAALVGLWVLLRAPGRVPARGPGVRDA